MSPRGLSVFLVPLCWFFVSVAQERTEPAPGGPAAPKPAVTNSSGGNHTHGSGDNTADLFSRLNVDSSMIQRALYVLIGITMIGVLYFLIRAVRLKKPTHRKKYGLLSNYDDSVEMEAVDSEEDDTLYDARSLRR